MPAVADSLLLKFRSKDGRFGVTRDTVKALANQLDTTGTPVVHVRPPALHSPADSD